ncbi:MAG: hypothetical protein A2V74_04420 [Acidobacteria bacterium RBG_16_70_10]|nr:MAG: hypothetical protein A2V74_04420 [Acidobacteria bacterium RBG_16_70_10]
MAYTYVWEYLVAPDKVGLFQRGYGPSGEWAELFRRAPGYLRTELHRDLSNPLRFLTVDYWQSRGDWEAFRARFSSEFEELDARGEKLTTRETEIGRFELAE